MARTKVSFCRHLKDRRFRKNENLILGIFISERKNSPTTKKIANKTKLSRSTIYIHHHAIKEIIPDYERYILVLFSSSTKKKLRQKNSQLKNLYFDMLVFILQNKKIFKMFLKFNDREIINKMVGKIKNQVIASTNLPKNSQKIFQIYTSEITEIIFMWGRANFSEDKLTQVLSDIMYLTETFASRLTPISYEY